MLHDFFAYFFIPVSSILFAGTSNWMTTNFSILRNGNQKEPLFLMWAFSVIICFSHWFGSLSQRLSYAGKAVLLVRISCVILGIAILTPYLPETFPFWSRIHFYCAFLSPFFFLLGLLMLLLCYRKKNPRAGRLYLTGFCLITSISLILLWTAGMVTSALEIFLTAASGVLLRRLRKRMEGS